MSPSFSPGHELAGRYRIQELLGVGSTAEVYVAEDISLNRIVTVKVLLAELSRHEDVRRAFRDNIVRVSALSHPHLERVYDGGQESGHIFMITEYLAGGSFEDVLSTGRTFDLSDSARLGRDVADCLSYLSDNGFALGELSPSTLLFDDEGHVRVSDVALAGLANPYRERFTLEDVRYLSPEQAIGDRATPKSDVYALALILFESATGQTPFEGLTPEALLGARINASLPVRPELGTLDMLLAQGAIGDPQYRLDAEQFANRLGGVVGDTSPFTLEFTAYKEPSVLGQFTPAPPRDSIGFNAPSASEITGATPVSFPLPQTPKTPMRHVISSTPSAFPESPRRSRRESLDELERTSPTKRRRFAFLVAAVAIVVVAVGGAGAWKLGLFTQKQQIPSLVGTTYTQAESLLKGDGFTLTITSQQHSSTVPANQIITQSPSAGTSAKSGQAITVVVSSGPQLVNMPSNIIGEDCVAATAQLAKLKITAQCPTTASVASATVPIGQVAKYLYNGTPNPLAVPVNATVILAISTGPAAGGGTTTTTTVPTVITGTAPRAVPSVVGDTQSQAVAAFKASGLFFHSSGPGAGTPKWTTVVSQSPAAGTKVAYHATVNIVVSESAPSSNATTTTTSTTSAGTHIVPNLIGMSYAQVVATVKKDLYFFTTTGPGAGTSKWTSVVSQSPLPGTPLAPNKTIHLHVEEVTSTTKTGSITKTTTAPTTTTTTKANTVTMPNVLGMNYAQAVAAMHKARLYFTTTGKGAGTITWTKVLAESPAAGTAVKVLSTVTLTVN